MHAAADGGAEAGVGGRLPDVSTLTRRDGPDRRGGGLRWSFMPSPRRPRIAALALIGCLAGPVPAWTQPAAEGDAGPPPAPPIAASAPFQGLFSPPGDAATQALTDPFAQAAAGPDRPCDGCPPRRVGNALLQTTYVNVLYGLANLIRGQDTAKITPATWWTNMKSGFEWDLDTFAVNQIGHPYQGNNYFTTGRGNGLSFWESAALTAFGSATWEYFGETNRASLNDFINTTLGGIALGEMFYRSAWLVRDTRATGGGRLRREILATALDPMTGLNRFLTGDAARVSEKPPGTTPSRLVGIASAGVLWRGDRTTGELSETARPFLEMGLLYGDLASGRSRTPYDAFLIRMRLGGGSAISEARVRGRLLGQPFSSERWQLNLSQAYDYQNNRAYRFGAQAFEGHLTRRVRMGGRTTASLSGWGGLIALGAVDSIGAPGKEPSDPDKPIQGESIDPRPYDYGPGSLFGGSAVFAWDGRIFASLFYQAHHLYSLDGARANHLLQQGRLDVPVPVRGAWGAGVSVEYFDRRTFFKAPEARTENVRFPQLRVYLTWTLS